MKTRFLRLIALVLTAAVLLGLVAGWVPRIRAFAYPIANVMAPIPAIVISPYLVALMCGTGRKTENEKTETEIKQGQRSVT